ncbi:MAG: diguanylate cyclase [Candidatus Wallbacteria bacterium]|nr:diguanylate cyclase [Candidatus Wallbacteria bacterium]
MKLIRIRHKLLALLLGINITLLGVSLYFSLNNSGTQLRHVMLKELRNSAGITSALLKNSLNEAFATAKIIAKFPGLMDALRKNDQKLAIDLLAQLDKELKQEYSSAWVGIFRNGRCWISDPANQEEKISAEPSKSFIQRIDLQDDQLMFHIQAPIYLESDLTPAAFLVLRQPLKNDFLDNVSELTGNNVTIANSRMEFITTTIRDQEGLRVKMRIEQKSLDTMYELETPGEAYPQLALTQKMPERDDFFLIISKSASALYENLAANQLFFGQLSVIIIILTFLIATLIARQFTRPIDSLVQGVTAVSKGDLDYRVTADTRDEIEFLASEFNIMAGKLKEKIGDLVSTNLKLDQKNRELAYINRANHAIINYPDVSQLLSKILEIVIEAIGCEHGSIMLLEENLLRTKVVKWTGREIGLSENIVLQKNQGIAGRAVETGEAVLVNDVSECDFFRPYEDQELNSNCRNMLCVPLTVENLTIGVINLLNKKDRFSIEDQKLGLSLAGEVAIALRNRQLYELAITDGLTGIYIHRYFQARLDEEMFRSRRFNTPLSLIMFDIDHFKNFNDRYGHQIGDIVLRHVAHTAKAAIRQEIDFISRYGGEEFAVVCPGTPYDGAVKLAERIRFSIETSAVSSAGLQHSETLKVTCSFGVSSFTEKLSKKELIELADSALYKAKEAGRNRVC